MPTKQIHVLQFINGEIRVHETTKKMNAADSKITTAKLKERGYFEVDRTYLSELTLNDDGGKWLVVRVRRMKAVKVTKMVFVSTYRFRVSMASTKEKFEFTGSAKANQILEFRKMKVSDGVCTLTHSDVSELIGKEPEFGGKDEVYVLRSVAKCGGDGSVVKKYKNKASIPAEFTQPLK